MARPGDLEFPMSKSSLSDKSHRPHASVPQPAWGRMSGPPFLSFTSIRTPLFDQLVSADAPEAKLIAIAAPTGYGKTVLMTGLYEHYQRRGATCHWLALDDRDVTIERLLTHLEALLTRLDTKVDVNQALHQGDHPVDERIGGLLDAMALLPRPTIFFIDNLSYCTDDTLCYLIDALVFDAPSWVHFVISSTGRLQFDQPRAKLEGLLYSIGPDALSFDQDGIARMLGGEVCARLSPDDVAQIAMQTEGWPSAVRLMQIILTNAQNPRNALTTFSGSDEDLALLLNRSVLQRLDEGARTFLLEISLLRSYCVDLCQSIRGNARAEHYVKALVDRNMFVIPLDRNRIWYRLHGLFREFLVDEAQRVISAPRRQEILVNAAKWCERNGYWQDAMTYALESESVDLGAAMLERVAAKFVRDRGDLRQYIEWIEQLHARGARSGPEAELWYVWALTFHRRYEYARQQMESLSRARNGNQIPAPRQSSRTDYERRLDVIRVTIGVYTDRLDDAHAHAVRWLEKDYNDDPFNVATVASANGIALTGANQLVEARKSMVIAHSYIAQANSDHGTAWVNLLSSMIVLREGDYVRAHQDLRATLARARAALGDATGITGTISLLAAKSAVELNLNDEARDRLAIGLRKAHTHGVIETTAAGLDAAVKLWSDTDKDFISLIELREVASAYPPRLSLMLSCFLIRRWLLIGNVDEAQREAVRIGLTADGGLSAPEACNTATAAELVTAARIELAIATRKFRHANTLIAAESSSAKAQGRHGRLVELALDEATINYLTGKNSVAVAHFGRAIRLAARHRALRVFIDRGELIASLVRDTGKKDWSFLVDEERQFFSEVCSLLPQKTGPLHEHLKALNFETALTELPTTRELELLALIDAGLSNQQIADRISVSVATVKWHLYNLYAKLGVSSRSAALARARDLKLNFY